MIGYSLLKGVEQGLSMRDAKEVEVTEAEERDAKARRKAQQKRWEDASHEAREMRESAPSVLNPLWDTSLDGCRNLSSNGTSAMDAIRQRLMHGTPIELRQSDADTITVPLQREYTGRKPVIPSSLADTLCSRFTPELLLLSVNSLMYTTFPMTEALSTLFQQYIDTPNMDFGTLYTRLRPHWVYQDFENFEDKRLQAAEEMSQCRQSMLGEGMIESINVPPRRFWDLYSNRVFDSSLLSHHWPGRVARHSWSECRPSDTILCLELLVRDVFAVSHSWAPLDKRVNAPTAINGHEWRVPIPDDITLDRVRIELLNLGGEYAWLDVLCLRQEDAEAEGEEYRKDEWALDVPTIGHVYSESLHVIHYFSGLGRPFEIGDMNSDRHWLNRAWTLQEIGKPGQRRTAGITDQSPTDPWLLMNGATGPFYDALEAASRIMDGFEFSIEADLILDALLSMRVRQCVNPLDRISGLAAPLEVQRLPIYDTSWGVEKVWGALVRGMRPGAIMVVSMLFLAPGAGAYRFLPSWNQVMEADASHWGSFRDNSLSTMIFGTLRLREDGQYTLGQEMRVIHNCRLEGLAEGELGVRRSGTADIPCHRSNKSIQRPCNSHTAIADGTYTLVSFVATDQVGRKNALRELVGTFVWLVGHIEKNRFFKDATLELCDLTFPKDWEAVGQSAKGLVLA